MTSSKKSPARGVQWLALLVGAFFFWVLLPGILLYLSAWIDVWAHIPPLPLGVVGAWLGVLLATAGLLLALWVVYVQMTIGQGTPLPFMPTQQLVQEGPFAFSRNPLFLGGLAYYFGLALAVGSLSALFLLAIGAIGLHLYVTKVEEAELEARFGETYQAYKRRVPRWIAFRKERHD
ncbi:MAG: isoprenylcysteine carboxylmethyltransferase family protein [Chloroflexi bacterium]|nr:isoprenylcysteine carboxylmethyltransferase family protein [Chloroflexota bacterium]